jgi:hypothetical protein
LKRSHIGRTESAICNPAWRIKGAHRHAEGCMRMHSSNRTDIGMSERLLIAMRDRTALDKGPLSPSASSWTSRIGRRNTAADRTLPN